jgi:hypothetical protein
LKIKSDRVKYLIEIYIKSFGNVWINIFSREW